jgi:hypothetical protein
VGDFGEAKFILGIDIIGNKVAVTVSLSQEQYTKALLLEKYGTPDNTPSKLLTAPVHYRDGEAAFDLDKIALSPLEHGTFSEILGSMNFIHVHVHTPRHCLCGQCYHPVTDNARPFTH